MDRILKIILLILFLPAAGLKCQVLPDGFAASSVLTSGKWFKIPVTEDGVYRIDFNTLRLLNLNYPSNPRIYGNNRGQLSYFNDDPRPDDLEELAIYLSTGNDDIFNEGDYLLFYGQGTGRWIYNKTAGNYSHIRHDYSDTAYYFITSSPASGLRIAGAPGPGPPPLYYSDASDTYSIHEAETDNILKSGREWYQPVTYLKETAIKPGFRDIITSEPVRYSIRILARASGPTVFRFYEGNTKLNDIFVDGVDISSSTGTYARIAELSGSSLPGSSFPEYEMRFFNNGEISAKGWIDYVVLQGRSRNVFDGQTKHFSDSRAVAPGQITEFSIRSTAEGAVIWDVTDPARPVAVTYDKNGNILTFRASTDSLKTFVAFTPEKAVKPSISGRLVKNQNLHGSGPAEMIIVTHPGFSYYAERLSEIHRRNSGLESMVATPGEIYNEFSGGIADIAAIRNFLRMKYLRQKGGSQPLRYLLLFGDGSYDNKTPPPGNPGFIPTYQSKNSNVIISSFTSDDFYGLLEAGEGEDSGTLDIGIGRLPVSDTTEAGIMIRKIAAYLSPSVSGDWKNVVALVADDEDGNTHMIDAEGLEQLLNNRAPEINIEKIYFDAFTQVTTANGQSYPDVNRAVNDRINTGCLIFNYTGHGNEISLGHERVVTVESIKQWQNKSRLPLFVTATCEFSRFDDMEINIMTNERKEKNSAGESVLLSKEGGGIALMSTTRLVYSAPNYSLNYNILDAAFDRTADGNFPRLGDIIRLAKNRSASGLNKRNFMLLGDPALRLAYPSDGFIVTDSVNSKSVTQASDTLKALDMVTVAGHVSDRHGVQINDFNGVVSSLVFDKPKKVKTLANDGGSPMEFNNSVNIIFNGRTRVSEGKFRFTFMVPRDIDYTPGQGKISYYAYNEENHLNGYFDRIVIGGFNNMAGPDADGPEISLYLNDTLFRDGGITDPNPRLLAIISDPGGINTAGSGIGHDIKCWLDDDRNSALILNNHFRSDFGSFSKGRISYDFSGLSAGRHTLTLKAWDNFNNSSEKSVTFFVEPGGRLVLKNLMNYPNPFSEITSFTVEHNRPGTASDITVTIYNMTGGIIRVIRTQVFSEGFQLPPVMWDRIDSGGNKVAGGLYPYKVTVNNQDGETASISGRLIIY